MVGLKKAVSIYSMVPGSIPGGVTLVALKIHGPSTKCCCTIPRKQRGIGGNVAKQKKRTYYEKVAYYGGSRTSSARRPGHADSAKLRHLQPYHLLLLRGTQTADAKMGCRRLLDN